MKIMCSKRDDVLTRKNQFDAERSKSQAAYNEQYNKYLHEKKEASDSLADDIKSVIPKGENLRIEVEQDFGGDTLRVHIDNGGTPHKPNQALAWDFTVRINEAGEVYAQTGSWSGLNAVTDEELADLRLTLGQLSAIKKIDWSVVLRRAFPKYKDYVSLKDPRLEATPDFKSELFQADIEDIAGDPTKAIKSKSGYYFIVKVTPKQVAYLRRPEYMMNDIKNYDLESALKYPDRMTIDRLRAKVGPDYEIITI